MRRVWEGDGFGVCVCVLQNVLTRKMWKDKEKLPEEEKHIKKNGTSLFLPFSLVSHDDLLITAAV